MDQLAQHIESIVFVSESPISFKEIKSCLEVTFETKFKKPALEKAIDELRTKYQEEQFSFEFLEIAGGFQFLTKPAFHNSVGTLLRQNNKRRLSKAALETLSIIAYKQPVVKSEMEKIRGVSCDYSVQKLLEKELIVMVGRSEAPGRPLLYGTSEKFMDYFGLKSLDEMPKPKDFRDPDNEIGEQAPIDESVAAAPVAEMLADVPPSSPTANEDAVVPIIDAETEVDNLSIETQIQSEENIIAAAEEISSEEVVATTEDMPSEAIVVTTELTEEMPSEETAVTTEFIEDIPPLEKEIISEEEALNKDIKNIENLDTDTEEDLGEIEDASSDNTEE